MIRWASKNVHENCVKSRCARGKLRLALNTVSSDLYARMMQVSYWVFPFASATVAARAIGRDSVIEVREMKICNR